MRPLVLVLLILCLAGPLAAAQPGSEKAASSGKVRVLDHAFADDHGPFLGLGVSYFSALWRCRNDPARLDSDLAFLASNQFNYFRMLSMVGYHPAWSGREIAPITFTNRAGKAVAAWPDYWDQLKRLIDGAYDRHRLRTQITIFADAQLMPGKGARQDHIRNLLAQVVAGREHKIIFIEVANEAWQNGFPGDEGVVELREHARFLNERTDIPIAITSNHDWPELGTVRGFSGLYSGGVSDLATWHFSRDRSPDAGWKPVYDCWTLGELPGLPPVISNEPIGPGASVNSESDPIKLVMAAAFAYSARLPAYLFHCEAGVFGKTAFEKTPAIDRFSPMLRLLPPDLANWQRNDGRDSNALFTVYADGKADRYWPEVNPRNARDGCVRNIGSRNGDSFVCLPIGIRAEGVELQAREHLSFDAFDPLTGKSVASHMLKRGERTRLKPGSGALILIGKRMADND